MNIYTLDYARTLDEQDKLRSFRKRFSLDDDSLIYLDGNSLGALPMATKAWMTEVVEKEWGEGLIRSWNTAWYERSAEIGAKLASVIGAQPDEVIMADSTSVNLFKLAYAALKFQEGRRDIISDQLNFPSDLYVLQGLVDLFGGKHKLMLAPADDGISVSDDALQDLMSNNTALVSLSHVVFKSAFKYDMQNITRMAHDNGALVLWDLSHAVGSVPIHLNASEADLAIGCTYKYLNGGPGSTAFLYVRKDLQQKLKSPIWGWFGQHRPFDFEPGYEPAEGIRRFLAGSIPLLSLSAVGPSLDIILEAGIDNLREKSIRQTTYMLKLIDALLVPLGFSIGSPIEPERRGSHLSIRHAEAYRICKAMIAPVKGKKAVIPDFRQPDNIRLGIAPLYNSFAELFEAVTRMKEIVEQQQYLYYEDDRGEATTT
jgi:kynureninase